MMTVDNMRVLAIDTALEELDLGQYPKTIAVVPPTPQETQQNFLEH